MKLVMVGHTRTGTFEGPQLDDEIRNRGILQKMYRIYSTVNVC